MKQRIISGIIITGYILIGFLAAGSEGVVKAAMFCLLPFFAIWFSDAMGDWTGTRIGAPSITNSSPGCVISFIGWLLLLAPIIAISISLLLIEK